MRNPIHEIRTFYQSVAGELRKCTWPSRSELTESTIVVIISVLILSVFVAFADLMSQALIRLVTGNWTG